MTYSPHDPVAAANAIHLLRTTQQHHAQLSAMADQKASILIGATFVVFTIILREGLDQALSPALLVLAASAFVSASLGVMAILKPKLEDFDELATAMIHDIYQLGLVLQHKKYRYLGYAYRVFFVGLMATFTTFLAEMALRAVS